MTLLAINLEKSGKSLGVSAGANLYALTATNMGSKAPLLNGQALALDEADRLPAINPIRVKGRQVNLAPHSVNYITLPRANNPSCQTWAE